MMQMIPCLDSSSWLSSSRQVRMMWQHLVGLARPSSDGVSGASRGQGLGIPPGVGRDTAHRLTPNSTASVLLQGRIQPLWSFTRGGR